MSLWMIFCVRRSQRLRNLTPDTHQIRNRKRSAGHVAQGRALHQFHRDGQPVSGFDDFVECDDVRMVQRGNGLRFPHQPLRRTSSECAGVEKLQGHHAVERRVAGRPYFTHPATPEQFGDYVTADLMRRTPCQGRDRIAGSVHV